MRSNIELQQLILMKVVHPIKSCGYLVNVLLLASGLYVSDDILAAVDMVNKATDVNRPVNYKLVYLFT